MQARGGERFLFNFVPVLCGTDRLLHAPGFHGADQVRGTVCSGSQVHFLTFERMGRTAIREYVSHRHCSHMPVMQQSLVEREVELG